MSMASSDVKSIVGKQLAVAVAYHPDDYDWAQRLEQSLRQLGVANIVNYEMAITELDKINVQADVVALLLGPTLFGPEGSNADTLVREVQRLRLSKLEVIPIVIGPAIWRRAFKAEARIKLRPEGGKPLAEMDQKAAEEELQRIAEQIAAAAGVHTSQASPAAESSGGTGSGQIAVGNNHPQPASATEGATPQPEPVRTGTVEGIKASPSSSGSPAPPAQGGLEAAAGSPAGDKEEAGLESAPRILSSSPASPTIFGGLEMHPDIPNGTPSAGPAAPTTGASGAPVGLEAAAPPTGNGANLSREEGFDLPSYSADAAAGDDWLDITPQVQAFARLIAAHDISPPLSIGIFGEWGSGKSFFMDQLSKAVNTLAQEAQKDPRPQSQIAFYKHIAQVEFNAWQYMQGNLWASLVDHILRNLRIAVSGRQPGTIEKMQNKVIEKLTSAKQAQAEADTRLKEAQVAQTAAQEAVDTARRKYEQAADQVKDLTVKNVAETVFANTDVRQKIQDVMTALNLQVVGTSVEDFQSALAEAEAVARRGNALFTPLVRDGRRMGLLIAVLIAVPVVGLVVAWLLEGAGQGTLAQIGALLTAAVTLIGGATEWIRRQTKWVSDTLGQVERVKKEIDLRITAEEDKLRGDLLAAEKDLDLAREGVAATEQAKVEADQRVAQVQAERAEATLPRLLSKFIQERVESNDYRKLLGILATVRQDFQELSDTISTVNTKLLDASITTSTDEEKDDEAYLINRIVLYIDDLDRCPPAKVVEVLQAVHLLLALDLFVVVVAVDARWIQRSLETRYGDLLQADPIAPSPGETEVKYASASPLDYLEKIFQIPFWISPMTKDGRKNMLTNLMQSHVAAPAASGNGYQAELPPPEPSGASAPGADGRGDRATQQGVARKRTAPDRPTAPPEPLNLNPSALVISDQEQEFIKGLWSLLGRSPRALKRFVNIYRLVKAGLGKQGHDAFLATGEFRIVVFLLALVTNVPPAAAAVFRAVDDLEREVVPSTTGWWSQPAEVWKRLPEQINKDSTIAGTAEWHQVEQWLYPKGANVALQTDWETLKRWAQRLARYSFRAEPGWLS